MRKKYPVFKTMEEPWEKKPSTWRRKKGEKGKRVKFLCFNCNRLVQRLELVIGTEFGFKKRTKPNAKKFSVFKTERPKIFGFETENQNRTLKIFGFKTENFRFLKPKKPKKNFWTLNIMWNSHIFTDFKRQCHIELIVT